MLGQWDDDFAVYKFSKSIPQINSLLLLYVYPPRTPPCSGGPETHEDGNKRL